MKTPIIKYNDKFLDRVSILMKIGSITLFPFIILREIYNSSDYYRSLSKRIINHESIHIKQQGELLVIGFYVLYVLEFIIRFILYLNKTEAYERLSFEREAKINEENPEYIKSRKFWAWTKYL